jgi:hypothetical protein
MTGAASKPIFSDSCKRLDDAATERTRQIAEVQKQRALEGGKVVRPTAAAIE